jgi:hypothetical protein
LLDALEHDDDLPPTRLVEARDRTALVSDAA